MELRHKPGFEVSNLPQKNDTPINFERVLGSNRPPQAKPQHTCHHYPHKTEVRLLVKVSRNEILRIGMRIFVSH